MNPTTTTTHFQDSKKENPNKTMSGRRRSRTWQWQSFISCGASINNNKKANSDTNSRPITTVFDENEWQLAHSSARNFTANPESETPSLHYDSSGRSFPALNINSALAVLPDSPSPICSSGSTSSPLSHTSFSSISDTFYSQTSCTLSNVSKLSESSLGIDGWIENGNNNLCFSYQPNLQMKGDEGVTTIDHEIHSISFASNGEEKSYHSWSEAESPINGHHKLITRPKPYHKFLDEIKRKELQDKVDALKNAKHMKYMDRLKKKEACISNWEFKETSKAMNEIKETQRKLEKERFKALEKKQKKISRIQSIAAEKKARERLSTSNKISSVTPVNQERSLVARSLLRLKLMRLVS